MPAEGVLMAGKELGAPLIVWRLAAQGVGLYRTRSEFCVRKAQQPYAYLKDVFERLPSQPASEPTDQLSSSSDSLNGNLQ